MHCNNDSAGGQLLGWLQKALDTNASDLHLVCGYPPVLRVHGKLSPIAEQGILSADFLERELEPILTEVQRVQFASELNLDYAVDIEIEKNRSLESIDEVASYLCLTIEDSKVDEVVRFTFSRENPANNSSSFRSFNT